MLVLASRHFKESRRFLNSRHTKDSRRSFIPAVLQIVLRHSKENRRFFNSRHIKESRRFLNVLIDFVAIGSLCKGHGDFF